MRCVCVFSFSFCAKAHARSVRRTFLELEALTRPPLLSFNYSVPTPIYIMYNVV